jgi:hypothetical protein
MLLAGFFELGPVLKTKAFELAGQPEPTSYAKPAEGATDPDPLTQLVAIDCAYLGVIAVLNFMFPYVLVPVGLNPAQLLVLPAERQSQPKASGSK